MGRSLDLTLRTVRLEALGGRQSVLHRLVNTFVAIADCHFWLVLFVKFMIIIWGLNLLVEADWCPGQHVYHVFERLEVLPRCITLFRIQIPFLTPLCLLYIVINVIVARVLMLLGKLIKDGKERLPLLNRLLRFKNRIDGQLLWSNLVKLAVREVEVGVKHRLQRLLLVC